MKHLYMFHNKLVGFYSAPFANEVDRDHMAEEIRRSIWLDIKGAKEQHLDECELVYLGDFDDEAGTIALSDKQIVCDCAGIYLQRLKLEKGELA